ncbi:MAG: DNA mismatch repair endonuclease MutL [bacterium]|nr:DNA mismatch repair endonuclease MutL [bacterium]
MSRIRVLPEVVANRIAAGEVVERPASVLKELVENAIDSGANRIEVQIRGAGRTLIQVTDNGSGMDRDDLLLAFERHATSKIRQFEDLEQLMSLGFRGEALPSIASVARIEVRTRMAEEETGWYLAIDAGRIVRIEPITAGVGSQFTVKSLFYNVPARRRFLKSNATEFGHIHVRFKRFALSNPQIGWKFFNDDELLYDLAPGTTTQRVEQLFGEKIAADLREIKYESDGIKLHGLVGTASLLRVQRGDQHLYLNGRAIRSPLITGGVTAGLGQIAEPGTYPFYILFLELSPRQFDINVHPSKEEAKFDNEPLLRRVVMEAVRDALRSGGLEEPTHRFDAESQSAKPVSDRYYPQAEPALPNAPVPHPHNGDSPHPTQPHAKRETGFFDAPQGYIPVRYRERPTEQYSFLQARRDYATPSGREAANASEESALLTALEGIHRGEAPQLWQMQGKYILVQVPSGLVMIDQHVAHERILYERATRTMARDGWPIQEMLFPIEFAASPEDVETVRELSSDLARVGFKLAIKDAKTLVLTGFPQGLRSGNEDQLVLQMLDLYRRDFEARPADMDRLAATFACKAAVKAGMPLATSEMLHLLEELFRCDLPYVCPHGRPVLIQLTIDELDRRFGRSGG